MFGIHRQQFQHTLKISKSIFDSHLKKVKAVTVVQEIEYGDKVN